MTQTYTQPGACSVAIIRFATTCYPRSHIWHGSEEVEHRSVAYDVAGYFHNSYPDRIRAMALAATAIFVFFQRATWYLLRSDPDNVIGWREMQRLRMRDSKLDCCHGFARCSGPTR